MPHDLWRKWTSLDLRDEKKTREAHPRDSNGRLARLVRSMVVSDANATLHKHGVRSLRNASSIRRTRCMRCHTAFAAARRTARPRNGTQDVCTWERGRWERHPTPRRASDVRRRPWWTTPLDATHPTRRSTCTKVHVAAQRRSSEERTNSGRLRTSRPSTPRRPNRRLATDERGRETSSETFQFHVRTHHRRVRRPAFDVHRRRSRRGSLGTLFSEVMAQARVLASTRTSLVRSRSSSDSGSNPVVDETAPCATDAILSTFAMCVRGMPQRTERTRG